MDLDRLRQLDQPSLNNYLWRRLRLEPPVDPPLGSRFAEEPPEQFIIQAVEQAGDTGFRARIVDAIRANLGRIATQQGVAGEELWKNPMTDQQVASLAFLTSGLEAAELVPALYRLACSWLIAGEPAVFELSDGQFHILRTLAHLQSGGQLAGFWQDLWKRGPRSVRGLVIFGWARVAAESALARLGELADMGDELDLSATIWSLIGRNGPGVRRVGEAASKLAPSQRDAIRNALETAGADWAILRDFDLAADFSDGLAGRFPFDSITVPTNPALAARLPRWQEAA